MDNPITPSLSDLVRRLRDLSERHIAVKDAIVDRDRRDFHSETSRALTDAANELERLSHLMAQGGLRAGATPLEEEEARMREVLAAELNKLREPDQKKITADMFANSVYRPYVAAMHVWGLLQANEVKRPLNPVDDGAVERATVPIKPTQAMLDAGCKALSTQKARDAILVAGTHGDIPIAQIKMRFRWAAMIAALEAAEPHP